MKLAPELNIHYLFESRRYLMLAIGAGVLALGLILLGFIPQVQAALDLQQKQTTETAKLKVLSKKAQDLENLSTSPLAGSIQTVEKVLPSHKPLLEFMTSLNQSAQDTQVSVVALTLSPGSIATDSAVPAGPVTSKTTKKKVAAATTDTMDVDLTVDGGLANLNQFFQAIENRAPLSTITAMTLDKKNTTVNAVGGASVFEAKITVSTYFFTQPVTSAVEASLPALTSSQQTLLDELKTFIVPTTTQPLQVEGGGLNDLFGIGLPPVEVSQ